MLAPLDRSGLFLAKATANLTLIAVVEAMLLPVFAVFFGLSLVLSTLQALSTRYRLTAGRMEIISGFVFRRVRTIDVAHVQNTEVVQPFTHRLLGLVQVIAAAFAVAALLLEAGHDEASTWPYGYAETYSGIALERAMRGSAQVVQAKERAWTELY